MTGDAENALFLKGELEQMQLYQGCIQSGRGNCGGYVLKWLRGGGAEIVLFAVNFIQRLVAYGSCTEFLEATRCFRSYSHVIQLIRVSALYCTKCAFIIPSYEWGQMCACSLWH